MSTETEDQLVRLSDCQRNRIAELEREVAELKSDYPNSDPIATGAPGSVVRDEWQAWQQLVFILKETDADEASFKIAALHSKSCTCEESHCRSFEAIRVWGEARAAVAVIQATRKLCGCGQDHGV